MEKQWDKSSSNNRSSNEDNENRSFQSIGKESREDESSENEMDHDEQNTRSSMSSNMGMSANGQDSQALSNVAYNWVTFVQNKAQAVKAYEQYISDAEEAGETECADLFRQACKADMEQLGQARQHLSSALKETESAE